MQTRWVILFFPSEFLVHDLLAFTFFAALAKVGCNSCSCNALPAGTYIDLSPIAY